MIRLCSVALVVCLLGSGIVTAQSAVRLWGGLPGDVPVPADYDGDGKIDIAIYRASKGVWWVLSSKSGNMDYQSVAWGVATDTPVPGDYFGAGRAQVAVYRPSTGQWFIYGSLFLERDACGGRPPIQCTPLAPEE